MKAIRNSRNHHFMTMVGVLLIAAALCMGMTGCSPAAVDDSPENGTTQQFNLTITCTYGGSVTTPGVDTFEYESGTEVDLVAEADTGHHFVNWTGETDEIADVSAATTTITMHDHYSITANFDINQYTLTYNAGAGGSIVGTTPQTVDHGSDGTEVEAVPDEGYHFVEWSDSSVENPRTDTSVTGDITVTANFDINQYTLTYNAGAGGSIVGTTLQTVNHGSDGTEVQAVPDEGYHFVEWSDSSIENPRTDTSVTGDITVTATFAINRHDLTIDSTEGGSVTTPGEGTFEYDYGTEVDLIAEADEHYSFVEWTGNITTILDPAAPETTITTEGDYSITAQFILFDGGSGEPDDPYEIANWHHLDNIRNYLDADFVLINDLDSDTAGYTELASGTANGSNGWQPIGTSDEAFTGIFDGQGHAIRHVVINRPDDDDVGLFGFVGEVGAISDVGLVSAAVTGRDRVGGLVGQSSGSVSNCYSSEGTVYARNRVGGLVGQSSGSVSNCYSSGGSVEAQGDRIGGLVGHNSGTVSNCYSSGGNVEARDRVGGLVGHNDGSISGSYSTDSVTARRQVGGLLGQNDKGSVSNSYAAGAVYGSDDDVGGLVGKSNSDTAILNSYATGSVKGKGNCVGGLIGKNDGATITNCYSTGSVSGDGGYVGGLVGKHDDGDVIDSFWDMDTSGQTGSDGGTGKTTLEMQNIATFTAVEWDIVLIDAYVDETWYIEDGVDYPRLGWQHSS